VGNYALCVVQDEVANRAAGTGSLPIVIGARATVRFAIAAYLLAGALPLFTPGRDRWRPCSHSHTR